MSQFALLAMKITHLDISSLKTYYARCFVSFINASTTTITMPSLDTIEVLNEVNNRVQIPATPGDHTNDDAKKDALFGAGN